LNSCIALVTFILTSFVEFKACDCVNSRFTPFDPVYQFPPPGVDPDRKDPVVFVANPVVVQAPPCPANLYCQEVPVLFIGVSPNLPTPLSHVPYTGYAYKS